MPVASFLVALTILDVPYLPQTPALCGGAAAAMVFRYWGDRHADVQQFAQYVDSKAGGIADDVLTEAIHQRQWRTDRITGSLDALRDRLAANQPVILLVDDRPGRYHYVVAVGADATAIYVHDPTWGPLRRHTDAELMRRWKPSGFWSLVVLPGESSDGGPTFRSGAAPELKVGPPYVTPPVPLRTDCDRLLDKAIDEIGRRGLAAADQLLQTVRDRCPRSAAPIAELAGVRFAQQQLDEAEALAREALRKDPSQGYAWDVLGSARFMRDDAVGALQAWNHIGKPRLDSIQIEGLTRTRYALVAESLRLSPNSVLTESAYRAAERRLRQLPSGLTTAIRYRPEDDGFATVNIVLVERPVRPRGLADWLGIAARAMADRELRATIPGWSGQGEAWSATWRWWQERPRAAVSFAAPRAFGLPGITRVEALWEQQTYRFAAEDVVRETQLHGGLTYTDWLTANMRYAIDVGVDSWDHRQRTAAVGAALEQSVFDDHVVLTAGSRVWSPISSGPAFGSGSLGAGFQSSGEVRGLVQTIDIGLDIVSHDAPLALWSGAGDGRARAPLLRAHPLLRAGVVTGSVFGRRTAHLTAETTRWFQQPSPARLGVAAFVDVARATHGIAAPQIHADIGTGVRIRLPGEEGILRADYAYGMRDGRNAFTIGWLITSRR